MALRTGYGTALYGSSKYGLPEVYDGQVSDSSATTATASGERIALGATAVETAVSHVVAGVRVQNGAVADSITSAATAAGFISISGAVSDTSTVSVALYWNRVRPFSAQDNVRIGANVNSRYKWLDVAGPTTVWSDIEPTSQTWNAITPPTTNWDTADYREGAA